MGDEILIAALLYVVACLALVLYQQKQTNKLRAKIDALTLLVKENDRQREAVKQELQELRSGTIGVGRRMLELEKRVTKQEARIDETVADEPQARLYTRAMKMVELGADIDELVKECELPKAEAELLLRLHGKGR
ncbi:DUF2802 domain-containing protein [Shewanella rhizosphaerae]|uniref:DUF2802 domain-containing protein n=1 Tax=Shewanella TaxID=22 RepID=UPI0016432BFB|nr:MULTISPECIES: DUF2802 domain-containing protein [Shewanella]QYJ91992.1 DUF2802 domain-containing protein [Shewanella halotolerans]QYJ99592.1 DUF2802 domain-containing protein [Shewanella alkalitolerans]QYK14890.1 DUF2802 domain-containing protein [Shewanella rhizosphaerae]